MKMVIIDYNKPTVIGSDNGLAPVQHQPLYEPMLEYC